MHLPLMCQALCHPMKPIALFTHRGFKKYIKGETEKIKDKRMERWNNINPKLYIMASQ